MKNKLTKIYNIFKQIENMNGSTGWDQIESFYYYFENNDLIRCWELLYGLFCENKNLKPGVFGITLLELSKLSSGRNCLYEFDSIANVPVLIATFTRNGKHQISGTVKVEETLVSNEKEVLFIDGINVDADDSNIKIEKTNDNLGLILTNIYNKDSIFIGFSSLDYINNFIESEQIFDEDQSLQFNRSDDGILLTEKFNNKDSIFISFKDFSKIINDYNPENSEELQSKEMFRINGEIPESLESIEDVKLFLDYLYDECNLVGAFHPDDRLDNYTDEHGDDLFNQQQVEKYNKYLDDMFELDADGDSEFVKAGYEDIYDYCMNYRNDNHGINENYPIKLNYGCTYVRRDGIISGQLDPVDGESSPGKNDMIFYDSENVLNYQINGKLIDGEYNRKNAEDLIAENFDYTSYLEDGKLSVGISFPAIPTKYPSSLNFVSDGLGGYVSYVTFEIGENSSEELRNFGLNVDWDKNTESWQITTKNGYYDKVFFNNDGLSKKFILQLNDVNHNCIITEDEEDENKFYLEFYDNNNELLGDCEVYTDELKMVIDVIEWTLPEYEEEIDPDGELFESEILLETINENF